MEALGEVGSIYRVLLAPAVYTYRWMEWSDRHSSKILMKYTQITQGGGVGAQILNYRSGVILVIPQHASVSDEIGCNIIHHIIVFFRAYIGLSWCSYYILLFSVYIYINVSLSYLYSYILFPLSLYYYVFMLDWCICVFGIYYIIFSFSVSFLFWIWLLFMLWVVFCIYLLYLYICLLYGISLISYDSSYLILRSWTLLWNAGFAMN